MEKNNKKIINGWCMYDWANSVYSLTITTAVFPSYFYGVTGGKGGITQFFGASVNNTVLYSYALSGAFLLVALLNPILSGIADYSGNKKRFMQFFCYLGAISCIALFWFDKSSVELGVIAFSLAGVGYAGSLVFYNSFLPEIATEDQFDRISAKGFSLGYIGSVILLIGNLLLILKPELFGLDPKDKTTEILAPKISFLSVGIWWIGFAQITFARLPNNVFKKKEKTNLLTKGFSELGKVWKQLKTLKKTRTFLIGFAFLSLGTQTVMYMATIFGEEVVGMKMEELIALVLILQLIAIPGAYGFSYISKLKGNIFSLSISLVIWVFVCIAAFFLKDGMKTEYYIIGILVGLVMGGVQSMSRSTYAKVIPKNTTDHASFFSFYETLEKLSISLGTFIYGMVKYVTGDISYSSLVLTIFFIMALIILNSIKGVGIPIENKKAE